jgi:hypothetical protein
MDLRPSLTRLDPFFGLGRFEGIHPDDEGDIYLIGDAKSILHL